MNETDVVTLSFQLLMETPESFHADVGRKLRDAFYRKLSPDLFLYFSKAFSGFFRLELADFHRMSRSVGVHIGKCKIFKTAFHFPHTKAVRNGGINLNRLDRNAVTLSLRHMMQRLHVVKAIRELH